MYKRRGEDIVVANPSGLCMCGCGQPTPLALRNYRKRGEVKGYPIKYIHGHHSRGKTGEQSGRWKGGRWQHQAGYIYVYAPSHPSANADGYVYEHRLVAEQILGRYLLPNEKAHHVNGIKWDNRPENVVVLTHSAHAKLHFPASLGRYFDAVRATSPES